MTPDPEPGFTITLREVWNALVKLQSSVSEIAPQTKRLDDHSRRLRKIERWIYIATGVALASGGTSIAAFLRH